MRRFVIILVLLIIFAHIMLATKTIDVQVITVEEGMGYKTTKTTWHWERLWGFLKDNGEKFFKNILEIKERLTP
ncbi:MAG: hypothetical protein ABH952_12400 [Candidatus Omnitrophota bacterium]